MSKKKLLAVRELIHEEQFDAARAVLNTMPGNDLAQRWLLKLDEIAPPTQPAIAEFSAQAVPVSATMNDTNRPIPLDDLSQLPNTDEPIPLDEISEMMEMAADAVLAQQWEIGIMTAEAIEGTEGTRIRLHRADGRQRELASSPIHTPHFLLAEVAGWMGKRGWQIAGIEKSADGRPYYILKRPV